MLTCDDCVRLCQIKFHSMYLFTAKVFYHIFGKETFDAHINQKTGLYLRAIPVQRLSKLKYLLLFEITKMYMWINFEVGGQQ